MFHLLELTNYRKDVNLREAKQQRSDWMGIQRSFLWQAASFEGLFDILSFILLRIIFNNYLMF